MTNFFGVVILVAGAIVPAFAQEFHASRDGADKPVGPGEPVCVRILLAEPDKTVVSGGLVAHTESGSTGMAIATFQHESESAIKMCATLNANSVPGMYYISDISLSTDKGKTKSYGYPDNFKDKVTFTFENQTKNPPAITEVKRVAP